MEAVVDETTMITHPLQQTMIPLLSLTTKQVLENCKQFNGMNNDTPTLFICSYPKSGTTWMQAIVYNIISNGNQHFHHISDFSPFYEIRATWDLDNNQIQSKYDDMHKRYNCQAFNTHLLWEMMPANVGMKFIYLVRRGKDVALSLYKHLSNQNDADCYQGTFTEFLQQWCDGQLIYGNWLDHISCWVNRSHSDTADNGGDRVLIMKYEDLIVDLHSSVLKVIDFLKLSDGIDRDRIIELTNYMTFSYMKGHQEQFMPISVPWKEGFSFIRKGTVGDSSNYFTDTDHCLFDEMSRRQFPDGLPHWLRELNVL